jgi:diguanylate cyclase (GGDEF)-like protein/PAS domain S-box-containing protein
MFNRKKQFYTLIPVIFQLIFLFLFILYPAHAQKTQSEFVKIGVLAYQGKTSAIKKWDAHAWYLNDKLKPFRFKVIALSYKDEELTHAVINNQVDFVITNPGHYTELEHAGYVSHIATRRLKRSNRVLDQFGGTVISQANRTELKNYKDLKNLHILIPSKSSLGGWQVHLREALKQGIDLQNDVKITELKNHQKVVTSINNGIADAGFIRSDLLEEMAAKGKIDILDFNIVNAQTNDNYPYKLSTQLYPEWPIAVVTGTSRDLAAKVLHALLEMHPDSEAAAQAGIEGWTISGQYNKVDELFRETFLGPYKQKPITLKLIINKYQFELLSFLSLLCLLLISGSIRISKANQKLHAENQLRISAQNNLLVLNKELKCLYELASLSEKYQSNENYLQEIVDILPIACEHPENFGIRIYYKNLNFQTKDFNPQIISNRQDIIVQDKTIGKVEFSYLEKLPDNAKELSFKRQDKFIQTAVKQIESTLQRVNAMDNLKLIASVFEHTNDGIIITDSKAHIIDVNQSFTELTGFTREEVIGNKPNILQSGRQNQNFYKVMWQSLIDEGEWKGHLWNKKKSGEIYAELLNISAIREQDGTVSKYIGVFSDITQYKKQQEKLEFLAHHDALTQLPNRILFRDRLKTSLALTRRSENLLAVAYLDLDGFKPINDTYGHDTGDKLLIEVAKRIIESIREGDSVARFGGDEFALLLSNILTVEECNIILNRVILQIASPYQINDQQVSLSASIGVTLYPLDSVDIDGLLRHADQAMYAAKTLGRNQFHLFDYNQDILSQSRHESIERIEQSFHNGEFVLYYQPKINIRSGTVIGVEVMLRWLHPQRGLLLPNDFLPLINSKLSILIDQWVLENSLHQLDIWRGLGINLKLALNLSSFYLYDHNFTQNIAGLLESYPKISGTSLQLQISENTILDNIIRITENIEYCQNLGFNIILNNFGSGYSSLACIKQISIDAISIDPIFIQGMLNNDADYSIVDAVIGLSQSFQHKIIAKGVDTQEHSLILLKMGCDIIQGDYISQPMEANKLPHWINKFSSHFSCEKAINDELSKEDLPFILVEYHHSAWIDRMLEFLKKDNSRIDKPPTLSHKKCYFGKWYHGIGKKQYGNLSEFKILGSIHKKIHDHAIKLCELKKSEKYTLLKSQSPLLIDLKNQMLESVSDLKVKVKKLNSK